MPCDCSYMEATALEKEMAKMACYIDELDGKFWTKKQHEGYHKKAYNQASRESADAMIQELCGRLSEKSTDEIKGYSLELQLWWRDHQEIDKARS